MGAEDSERIADLRRLLEGHVGLTDAEHRDKDAMLRLLDRAGETSFSRNHWDPGHFTASGFVLSSQGALLLVHHPRFSRWLQPGGHIEPEDPSVEAAARREVMEETGVAPDESLGLVDLSVHEIPRYRNEPRHRHFDVRFGFSFSGDTALPTSGPPARWVPVDDLPSLDTDHSVRRASVRLRSPRAGRR